MTPHHKMIIFGGLAAAESKSPGRLAGAYAAEISGETSEKENFKKGNIVVHEVHIEYSKASDMMGTAYMNANKQTEEATISTSLASGKCYPEASKARPGLMDEIHKHAASLLFITVEDIYPLLEYMICLYFDEEAAENVAFMRTTAEAHHQWRQTRDKIPYQRLMKPMVSGSVALSKTTPDPGLGTMCIIAGPHSDICIFIEKTHGADRLQNFKGAQGRDEDLTFKAYLHEVLPSLSTALQPTSSRIMSTTRAKIANRGM
ncbi:hypothetical protein DFS33DRAFT_1278025 [Desarmillaria ectypa]|nr:hypothetical protein DFS33DRAFT_1278025 [Desarmillaria ectypa]